MSFDLKNVKFGSAEEKPAAVTPVANKSNAPFDLKNVKFKEEPKQFEKDYMPIIKNIKGVEDVDFKFIADVYDGKFSKVYAENKKTAKADEVARNVVKYMNGTNPVLKKINVGIPNVLANLQQDNKSYSEDFVEKYKTLEKHNNDFLKILKAGGDATQAYTNAYNAYQSFKTTLAPDNFKNNSGYVIRPEDNKFMHHKDYDREHDGPSGVYDKKKGTPKMSSTVDTNADLGYKTIVDNERAIQQSYLKYSTPLMGAWSANTSKILNKYATGKDLDEDDIDNAQKSFAFTTDLLTHVSKYGTVSGDSKNKDRGTAMEILKQANSIKEPKAKYAFLAKKSNEISKITGSLGFYGTKYLFDKHHDALNHEDFYGASSLDSAFNQNGVARKNEELLRSRQGMIRTGTLFNNFSKVDKTARTQAKEKMYAEDLDVELAGFIDQNTMVNSFFDKSGHIRSRADFEQSLYRESMKQTYKGAKINFDDMVFEDGRAKINGRNDWSPLRYRIAQDNNRAKGKIDEAYERLNKVFKKKFNDIDPSERYANSLMVLAEDKNGNKIGGFGNETSQVVALRGLDFSSKNTTGKMEKFKTIQNVLSMVNEKASGFTRGGIYITDNKIDEKLNAFDNRFQDDDETSKRLHTFLAQAGQNVTAEFYAHPGGNRNFSSYVFKDEDTGKKMAMFIPNNYLSEIKDPHYTAARQSPSDFTYNYAGEKPLLNTKGFKNSKIVHKDGILVGQTLVPSTDFPGSFERMEFNIGPASSTSWDNAELHFYDALKQYKELQKQEEK